MTKLYTIECGDFKLDGGAMFGVVPKVIWQKSYPADENNLCNWANRSLLIEKDDRLILIDNGLGDKQDESFFKHYYLNGDDSMEKSFSNSGHSYDDVTDVILTHLHFDHCGGGVVYNDDRSELLLAFPNATYWVSQQQWDLAINPNRREKASFLEENILPMKSNLKLIINETEIYPGIMLKLFNGHTDGQIIPHIQYKEHTLVFMADLLPSTVHIPLPYVMSYDTRPLLTLKEKERFLNEAVEKNYILFFEHDLFNECCTVKMTKKGVRQDKVFTLEAFIDNTD